MPEGNPTYGGPNDPYQGTTGPKEPAKTSTAEQTMNEVRQQAEQQSARFAEQAERKVNTGKDRVASSLERAAQGLDRRADQLPGGDRVRQTAHRAASKIGDTAGYLRSHDARDMGRDVRAMVESHPGRSMLAMLAVGFLFGRAFRGR